MFSKKAALAELGAARDKLQVRLVAMEAAIAAISALPATPATNPTNGQVETKKGKKGGGWKWTYAQRKRQSARMKEVWAQKKRKRK